MLRDPNADKWHTLSLQVRTWLSSSVDYTVMPSSFLFQNAAPTNADPRTKDDPPLPPATWLSILERLIERWSWADTLALLAVALLFSWVWRLSHGRINLYHYRHQRAADT